MTEKLAYGPVPSRRLGQSMGINNIPPKTCTYACVYCQLGETTQMQVKRDSFYSVEKIYDNVKERVRIAEENNETIDYITFVPDGEPTLDENIGEEIKAVKEFGYKIAVISNSSLIWDDDVKEALYEADWVSFKVDAVDRDIWKKLNRPYKDLDLERILEGIEEFSLNFTGELTTETMLVEGLNDGTESLERIAEKITEINSDISYIAVPTRPPAEDWVNPPHESKINEAYQIFKERGLEVEYLIGYEGDTFASSGDVEDDLLSITSVHPMRERQVDKLLSKSGKDWDDVEKLIDEGKLIETEFKSDKFYMRKLN
ncbi:MAG: radical SAM protein [Thermoplasmatota archaeon]